ncbi:hypothetical protein HYC85_020260 [Camellia sinensis]|uniref:Uncharacterized protein n=1 Tax=Camellia sinensis TaxID=4442 RepID=A0A7J7GT58_CAMSI|nr:hypothetical protein HYC85_020260 [Camellia sinensis]
MYGLKRSLARILEVTRTAALSSVQYFVPYQKSLVGFEDLAKEVKEAKNVGFEDFAKEAKNVLKFQNYIMMLLLVPASWASNFFYTYQFNNVNGVLFNLRTRGLNNVFYWGAQMIGSVMIGHLMDFSFKSRRVRGFVGIGVVGLLGTGIWAGGLANQVRYSCHHELERLDLKDSGSSFAGPFVLYPEHGLLVQSATATIAWQVDTHKVPFLNQLIANLVMTMISYPLLAVLVFLAVKDDSTTEEVKTKDIDFPAVMPIPASTDDTKGGLGKST